MTTSASTKTLSRARGSSARRSGRGEVGRSRAGGAAGLRLCFVTPLPPDRYSGANFHAVWLAERLTELGASVQFVTFSDGPGRTGSMGGRFPCHFLAKRFSRLPELALLPELARHLRRERYDVVHVHSTGYLGSLAGVAARCAGAAGVATIMQEGGLLAREGRITPTLHRALLRAFDHIVPISAETWDEAVGAGFDPARLTRIPISVDVERFRPVDPDRRRELRARFGLPASGPVVAHVGALCHRKNVLWLLDRWAAGGPEGARLLLVGDAANDPEGPEVRREVEARVAASCGRVRWIPFVREVEQVYAASDVLVLPSLREGMPTVVLQAMASGLPVVSTPVSGVPELVGREGERGALFPVDDAAAFAEGLRRLLHDGERRRSVTRAAREHVVAHYSLDAVAHAHLEMYAGLAAARAP